MVEKMLPEKREKDKLEKDKREKDRQGKDNPGKRSAQTRGGQPAAGQPTVRPAVRRRVADPRLLPLARLAAGWKADLERCRDDSAVETVHRVRTGTRRIEAVLDVLMGEAGEGNADLINAAARWRQQLKKIRRAAGPVRDLDVHRQLIESFPGLGRTAEEAHTGDDGKAATDGVPGDEVPGDGVQQAATGENREALLRQVETLDAWLKHAREHHSGELTRQIVKRLGKLDGLAAAFASAWQSRVGRARAAKPALAALDAFVELSEEMRVLDGGNLHDFRKRAKKARYMTEAGGDDAHAVAIGRAIKKVQDAIGDWHDWLSLAGEARTALDDEGQTLIGILDAEVARSFAAAQRVTERMRGRLVGEWRAMHRV